MTISALVRNVFGSGKAQARRLAGPGDADVRHCAQYRHCFPSMEVSYPGGSVRNHAVARWVREQDVGVQVRSSAELDAVISAGVHPARMTVHADGVSANELVFCAASLAVGFIVVNTVEHCNGLVVGSRRRQAVLVGVTDGASDGYIAAVSRAAAVSARLHLTGLHADVGVTLRDFISYPAAIGDLVCRMRHIQESHGRVLTRLSLGGVLDATDTWIAEANRQSALIDQSLDDACLTVDFPRPTVVVSASASTREANAA